ncbi:MAG: hypothetical protein A2206_00050 [Candidatus Magasanikbacteria bacterium RIFOXYA1_FULL_40_8]|uniref:GIY-YIG domain-containing protein n=1 Tax=Candidatus Magasanikbacteria bacterium RIFOXYA1_FULL_40_8 TaxID=1798694 RepID=A0A1F6NU08_9BACT|nr:MAG: hypothetical protein A2206_00050 [Candidatus Magasanikbacteria bacterium RIFOXYA1_FULL_40_8]
MYYVYLLESEKNGKIYVGSTKNLKERLDYHNKKGEFYTRQHKPWKLIYYEAYNKEELARMREKRLKHNGNALRELKKRAGLPSTTSFVKKNEEGLPSTTSFVKRSGAGFSMVEIIIAIAIALFFFSSIYGIISFSNKIMHEGLRKTEAIQFAQEGIEIVRTIKNNNWTDDIATLTSGVAYYPVIVDGRWTLTAVAQPAINGVFTRTITIYSVNRDVNDDIAEAGTDDPKTKRIVASVSWLERGNNEAVSLQAYLTNFLNN